MAKLFGVLTAFFWIKFSLASTLYSIGDLEILAQQKNYSEFIEHAYDIRPTERDTKWKELFSLSATGLVDQSKALRNYSRERLQLLNRLSQAYELKSDDIYNLKRSQYISEYISYCLKNIDYQRCEKDLLSSFNLRPLTDDIQIDLIKRVLKVKPGLDIFPYIKNYLKVPESTYYCQSQDILKSLSYEVLSKTSRFKQNQLSSDCLKELNQFLFQKTFKLSDRDTFYKIYHFLTPYLKKHPTKEKSLLISYLIKGPKQKDLFNRSWNLLNRLGENYREREIILKSLGKDLKSFDDYQPNTVVMRNLSKNYPELLIIDEVKSGYSALKKKSSP